MNSSAIPYFFIFSMLMLFAVCVVALAITRKPEFFIIGLQVAALMLTIIPAGVTSDYVMDRMIKRGDL